MTKRELLDTIEALDVADDTIIVKSSGIGFEDVYSVRVQTIFNSFGNENELTAVVLD